VEEAAGSNLSSSQCAAARVSATLSLWLPPIILKNLTSSKNILKKVGTPKEFFL
jgi:hypothetical protein